MLEKNNDIFELRKHWWAYIYDQYERSSDDIRLMLELIGSTPQNIFEVCCGSGRVLVPLAKSGHIVTGIDADEGMLARISAKSTGLSNLKYSFADALTTDWGSGYDVVVLADNTLMNIEHRDDDKAAQILFIKKAANALKIGGHFFLAFDHYPAPENVFISRGNGERGYYGTDDNGIYGEIHSYGGLYDPVTQIASWLLHLELTLSDGTKYIIPEFGHKYVCTREEVHGWLLDAGFVIEEEFGDTNRAPFTGEQSCDIIWARKM